MIEHYESWMKRALNLAQQAADAGEVPVGALIVKGDEVIGEGFNKPITSNDPTAHAEIIALREAASNQNNYRLPGTTLFVTIEPCTMCVGALIHGRIDTVVFGAREPRAGALLSKMQLHLQDHYNHKMNVVEGVLENECSALMRNFFKARRA